MVFLMCKLSSIIFFPKNIFSLEGAGIREKQSGTVPSARGRAAGPLLPQPWGSWGCRTELAREQLIVWYKGSWAPPQLSSYGLWVTSVGRDSFFKGVVSGRLALLQGLWKILHIQECMGNRNWTLWSWGEKTWVLDGAKEGGGESGRS